MKPNLALIPAALLWVGLLGACNTQPTRPSLPEPSSPPAPSSSSSQAQSQSAQSQSQSSQAQSQAAQAQNQADGARTQAKQQQSSASAQPSSAQSAAAEAAPASQSDDEVLSRAMEDFQRQSANAAQPGQTQSQGATGDWSDAQGKTTTPSQGAASPASPGTPQNWGSAPGEDGRQANLPPPSGGGHPSSGGQPNQQPSPPAGGADAAAAAAQPGYGTPAAGGGTAGQQQSVDQYGKSVIVIPGRAASTDREQVATLDRRLNKEMVEFDGMILREREGVKDRENESGASTGGGLSETGTGYGVSGTGPGGGGEGDVPGGVFGSGAVGGAPPMPRETPTGADSGGGNRPLDGGDDRAGDYQHNVAVAPIPDDIPDGKDDDVVARQLREAAMRETDPELREKLWNEYRKYKRELRGR